MTILLGVLLNKFDSLMARLLSNAKFKYFME